jgi:hypothetical protein
MNPPAPPKKDNGVFITAIGLAALLGLFLRLYLLKDQVFADDEWHCLYFAIGKSPWWLLTHFSIPGATCIPLNFYTALLGATVGWSETLLRLPSVICGILCVIVCPFLARPLIGTRPAAWLALLLAICPVLIFYSRIARPYSAVAFLAFAALLFAGHWARFGDRRSAALYLAAGVLAVYFHVYAVITVLTPAAMAVFYFLRNRFPKKDAVLEVKPILQHWLIAGAAITVISGLLMLPAVYHVMQDKFYNVSFTGALSYHSLPRVVMFLAGTREPLLMLLFLAAMVAGIFNQCRTNPWFGWMLLSLYPLHAIALLISHPDAAQSAIILVRYSIPLVPVSLLFAACGIQAAFDAVTVRLPFRPILEMLMVLGGMVCLLVEGPLRQCYTAPNNFTSHGVYQHFYGQHDWSRSFYSDFGPPGFDMDTVVPVSEISPFYGTLAKNPDDHPLVEYPMMIGDHFDTFYYYQHFHKHPVIIGYTTDAVLPNRYSFGNIYGDTYVDQILSLAPNPSRLHFHNFIAMDDVAAMRARHVEYIILHKRFESELPQIAAPLPDLDRLDKKYHQQLGAPAYEDDHIVVFRL